MNAQWSIAAVVVALSAGCAVWMLMPASLRRVLAAALLRLALPQAIAARLRTHAERSGACGCSGCDRNPLASTNAGRMAPDKARPITLHRRTPG